MSVQQLQRGTATAVALEGGSTPLRRAATLVVEDNSINRLLLCRQVTELGHRVAAVENGCRALERLRAERFDLVLLDVRMPEMDGYAVLEQMQADRHLRDLPVIVISGVQELESVVRCIEGGAADYLPKPFNATLLKARIGACLEKKWRHDQEIEDLQRVAELTAAAAAVEAGTFAPQDLEAVTGRGDELGRLARVFQWMAREIQAGEQRLKQQVQQLRVEIDDVRRQRQVAEITETDSFQQLQQTAFNLRNWRCLEARG
jgi:two-component system cell cycle response regulator